MSWTDSTISRFAQDGETTIAVGNNLIIDRVSISLTASLGQYQLPNYVTNITRVTWQGYTLEPYSGKEMVWSGSYPLNVTSGQPRFYIYSDIGQRVIKLYPTPSVDLPAAVTDLWESTAIENSFIVEFYRQPDFTSSVLRLPSEIRRQFVKNFVLKDCFRQEGKGQDLKAAEYFHKATMADQRLIETYKRNLTKSIIDSMQPKPITAAYGKPARPQLPPQFGVTV